jgi:signal transduction histidine kinase
MSGVDSYRRLYADELARVLAGAGEDALNSAYEIGRRALADGFGILDVLAFHHAATLELLAKGHAAEPRLLQAASSLLAEALSPFEMSYRAVDEANMVLRRLNEVLEGEARRIAHALHDQAASIVASATLELDLAVPELPSAALTQVASVRRLLDETGEQLRHLSHELRPTILDDLGLQRALEFLTEGVEKRNRVRIDVRGELRERFPSQVETAVYRIAQEALNNAVLHGGECITLTVVLERQGRALRCVIADDGVGFDAERTLLSGARGGLGLLGMRERAHAVGGTCDIRSVPGEGTSIEVTVPVAEPG